MFDVETANTAWKRLENFEVHFRGPVGSIEGPSRVLDLMRVHLSVPRVPWYVFCCLEVHTIANMANFLGGPIWPPPGLIKDSQTSVWWGLISHKLLQQLTQIFWNSLKSSLNVPNLQILAKTWLRFSQNFLRIFIQTNFQKFSRIFLSQKIS